MYRVTLGSSLVERVSSTSTAFNNSSIVTTAGDDDDDDDDDDADDDDDDDADDDGAVSRSSNSGLGDAAGDESLSEITFGSKPFVFMCCCKEVRATK